MKTPSVRYGFLFIIAVALFVTAILSSMFGAGYIMLVWLGWQVQASASLLVIIFLLLVLLTAYVLAWARQYKIKKSIRVRQCPGDVSNLNWFEQLGCYWLLDAKLSKQQDIQKIFNQSGLLNHLIDARLKREAGDAEGARTALSQTPAAIDALSELEVIKLLMLEQQHEAAIQQLQRLQLQEKSAFVQSLEPAYQHQLDLLWKNVSLQSPWLVLDHQPEQQLINDEQFLGVLTEQIAQSTDEQQQQLLALYDQWQASYPVLLSIQLGKSWLALLSVLPDTQQRIEKLCEQLLNIQFEPALFDCWLQNQCAQGKISDEATQQHIYEFAAKYPAQPSIDYAQWHVYQATQQFEAANTLLSNWPQDIRFCYLRLKQALAEQPQLLADVDVLFSELNR